MCTVDEATQAYIDGIAPQNRPLFDRLHGLILGTYPDAAVGLSYGMPAYTAATSQPAEASRAALRKASQAMVSAAATPW